MSAFSQPNNTFIIDFAASLCASFCHFVGSTLHFCHEMIVRLLFVADSDHLRDYYSHGSMLFATLAIKAGHSPISLRAPIEGTKSRYPSACNA